MITLQKSISDGLFDQLGIMPLQTRTRHNVCLLMHKIITNIAPDYLISMFQLKCSRYASMETKLNVPRPQTDLFKSSFSYQGATAWNNIPMHIRNIHDPLEFRRSLERFLKPP